MIKKIEIENFKSIYDKQIISFEKSKIEYKEGYIQKDVINPVLFYGMNGTGKSNILSVFKSLYYLLHLNPANDREEVIFDFNRYYSNADEVVKIAIEFSLSFGDFRYEIVGTNFRDILKERLINLDTKDDYLKDYSKNETYKYSLLREEEIQNKYIEVEKAFIFLKKIYIISIDGEKFFETKKSMLDIIRDNNEKINELVEKINGLQKVKFIKENNPEGDVILYYREVIDNNTENIEHKINKNYEFDKKNNTLYGPKLRVDYFMSSGTIKVYDLLAMLIEIPVDSIVIIDEIETKLHPLLIMSFLEIFNEYFKLQLITTTHNTTIMKNIRPDQILITERINEKTNVKKVSDIKTRIRKKQNLEKMYFDVFLDTKTINDKKKGENNEI